LAVLGKRGPSKQAVQLRTTKQAHPVENKEDLPVEDKEDRPVENKAAAENARSSRVGRTNSVAKYVYYPIYHYSTNQSILQDFPNLPRSF
jgi:hypothetical protein